MIVWLEAEALLVLHDRSLALFGGPAGVRDQGLLEAALQRPKNLNYYDGLTDIPALAAAYAVGVSANHPFIDGNKRAAFHALTLFLRLNGKRLNADPADAALAIIALAAGKFEEADLTEWIRRNSADEPLP